jgi:hypothetical protein
MFITTNNGLAFASSKFQRDLGNGGFIYPACLTDVFLGTLVWLQSPARVASINKRKLIAECYAALQPSPTLLRKYLNEVDQLKDSGKINDEEYYLLRTQRSAMNLLNEKTLGDPDNFTYKTPEEILDLIKQEYQAAPTIKYLETKDRLEETAAELELAKNETAELKLRIHERAKKISTILGLIIFWTLVAIFIFGLLIQITDRIITLPTYLKIPLLVVTIVLGILNIATGLNIKGCRDRIVTLVTSMIKGFFQS